MKGERKLRLVGRAEAHPPEGAEPPFTDEEAAAAAALREALDAGAEPLAIELQAAAGPEPIDLDDLDAIVSRAMGDDTAATQAERAAAERLRAELQGEAPPSDDAEILRALTLAYRPTDLPAARHKTLIDDALSRAAFRRSGSHGPRRIAPVTMAALASVAAIAAGVAIFAGRVPADRDPVAANAAGTTWARERSSDGLFDAATPFPRRGQESARIDRIASARAADLRQNRFAAWGVK